MTGRILLANEAGTGRGHVTTLKVFAEALGPSFTYDAALTRLNHASDVAPLCDQVFRGASLRPRPDLMAARAGRPIGNWGEWLAVLGFASEAFLTTQIEWWIRTIQARCSGLVVAEFAPCAMLAARALGVPVISIGQGHSTPPAGMAAYPAEQGPQSVLYDERELTDIVNRAGRPFGLMPLEHFSDVYRCDAQLPRTIAALDPYAPWRNTPTYLPSLGLDAPHEATGDEVFVYFSTKEGDDPAIVEAMASVDLPMRVVMSKIVPEFAARLESRGVTVERTPLPHALIARRSRIIVHAGQHGATCLGLTLGMPQVALPGQSEQAENARRIAALGVARHFPQPRSDAAAITEAIHATYADATMAQRARELATTLRPVLVGDTAAILRATVDGIFQRLAA